MLTLLLVLFIVLFSISVVNKSKFISLSESLASAFGSGHKSVLDGGQALQQTAASAQGQQLIVPGVAVQPDSGAANNQTTGGRTAAARSYDQKVLSELDTFRKIRKAIQNALAQHNMTNAVQFSIDRRGLVITMLTNALVFPGNSATLLPGGENILAVVAPPLQRDTHAVEVDGFTNQANVSTYPYPSGWELSSARASAVVRYLIAAGVAPSRLSAVGWSDQRPLVPPSDPRSITRNRRVEIVVLSSLPPGVQQELPAANRDVPQK